MASIALALESGEVLEIQGTCLRYSFRAAPEFFGNYTSGRIHRVALSGLKANSVYNYSLHGDDASVQRQFKTLPSSKPLGKDERYPFTFGVIGDLGQTLDSEQTVRHLHADESIQVILHAGDMSYADTNGGRWDSYGLKVEPLASRVQWMVCPGNHEIESDWLTGESFVPYEARFFMPAVREAESSPSVEQIGCAHPWPIRPHTGKDCTPSIFTGHYDWGNSFYAFDAGPARVIALNSYTYTDPSSAQYQWLKSELESLATRRRETPWLIVMMHCPFYTSNVAHHDEQQAILMRDFHGFEELFKQHQVAIVISGHVHAYERMHPVYQNVSQDGAPTYIVVGDGRNREGHADKYRAPPGWSAFRNGLQFGHGRLVIKNATHMRWEWYINDPYRPPFWVRRAAAANWSGPLTRRTVDDAVWLVNPYRAQKPHGKGMNASLVSLAIGSALAILVVVSVAVCTVSARGGRKGTRRCWRPRKREEGSEEGLPQGSRDFKALQATGHRQSVII